MASFGSDKVAFLLVGGRSILGSRTAIDFDTTSPVKSKTPLGVSGVVKEHTGVERASLSQKGYFDETTGGANEALMGAAGRASQVVCLGFQDNVIGREMVGLSGALVANYKRGIQVEEFHSADAEMESTGAVDDDCVILMAHAAQTGATPGGTAVDNGASSDTGLVAYLQCSALTLGGYTNIIYKIQHSADDNTYADLVTFTAITAAPTAERKTIAAGVTINRYLKVVSAYTGAGTGQSVTALIGAERY